jgi:monoamine oxidase
MRSQFWKANGQSGFADTDLPSARFWALGPSSSIQRGLLLSYAIGAQAAKLDLRDVQGCERQTLADAELVFPGASEHCESVLSKSWGQDPWQLGGLSTFAPGKLKCISVCAPREERILFAGEHTSRWNGWMEGRDRICAPGSEGDSQIKLDARP